MNERQVQFDQAKFRDVVHYICARCPSEKLGSVKLNKVLYYADMVKFALEGTPLTGATYKKRQFGPAVSRLVPMLRQLESDGAISIRQVDYFGYRKWAFESKREPNLSRLSEYDRGLLNDVIDFVCFNNTAKTISELSHTRAWERVNFGDEMPYQSAFYLFPAIVSQEAVEWGTRESAALEATTIGNSNVEYSTPENFRERLAKSR